MDGHGSTPYEEMKALQDRLNEGVRLAGRPIPTDTADV